MDRPIVGLVLGDATGIGPELCARVLGSSMGSTAVRLLVVGDARVLDVGARDAQIPIAHRTYDTVGQVDWDAPTVPVLDVGNLDPAGLTRGAVSADAGRAVGEWLAHAVQLAAGGELDAVTYAPLNKAALNAGGWRHPDDLHLVCSVLGFDGLCGELNVLEELWTSRVTSHVPLRDVAAHVTEVAVGNAIHLIDGALRRAGVGRPRIVVAALNPHAGDGGLCGDEEGTIILPAIERARAAGVDCDGPFAADTVFLRARAGAYHAVVSMYHDQGQIATKLLGFSRGVTVLAGLPVVLTTPAHGTAHDIAGRGVADPAALEHALRLAARLAAGRSAAAPALTA
jgi:4-hydroxythreonine-4-phosphate dehydrogenase